MGSFSCNIIPWDKNVYPLYSSCGIKKNKTVGIWILKTGILIRDVPKQVEYYKWEQLEEAIIENGYVTQTNSPSRHYSVKMLRIDFKVNQIHRLRFKGERGSKL